MRGRRLSAADTGPAGSRWDLGATPGRLARVTSHSAGVEGEMYHPAAVAVCSRGDTTGPRRRGVIPPQPVVRGSSDAELTRALRDPRSKIERSWVRGGREDVPRPFLGRCGAADFGALREAM